MVTPFISKLVHLLSHRDFQEVIRWTDAGDAFVFAHTSPVLLEVFARFFRHSNVHSFVRQLNIYDFQRLSTLALLEAIQTSSLPNGSASLSASDYSAFTHPRLWRDGALNRPPCDLTKIKPKATKGKGKAASSKKANGGAKRKTLGTDGEKAGGVRSRVNV
ncbi:HSF-type DNA-binding-domain-containing protein [Leucosporidium creatinivorum]|uniref:HSF-type DNA-binding-domain-containing protein n=1 Tax=Leucosporidium creatinivorum TaxID=106004 RepID=A0A1Y2FPM1_9BASI|nr:HSF-type DNA-binding-domain-containing protein [Leucosporidium creatinivorum]